MFKSARIKLTIWYLAIILSITGSLSLFFYRGTIMVMQNQFTRIERRLELREEGFNLPPGPRVLPADLEVAKKEISRQLLLVNSLVALVFGFAGYIFAGRTLRPIEQAMEKQKRFISDASHELKTPLTALKTAIEVDLRDKKLSLESKKILRENLKEVDSLTRLVNYLLKLSRDPEKKLVFEPVSVRLITNEAIKFVAFQAKRKKITIKSKLTPKTAVVLGPEIALVELLGIFLDNAVKYTNKGGKVWLSIVSKKAATEIYFKDNGVGIDKKDIDRIFDRFYRVDPARSKTTAGGYGLGLSLAKEIIDQLGGSVGVESKVGKGTRFTIRLPLKRA